MNNDLSILSERELIKKIDDCIRSKNNISDLLVINLRDLNKITKRKRVNLKKYNTLTYRRDILEKTSKLLEEYSKTIIDEQNTRSHTSKEDEDLQTHKELVATPEEIINYTLKKWGYDEDLIHVAIDTAKKSPSLTKAVKTLKADHPSIGLQDTKKIMDHIFKYLKKENHD